MHKIKICVVSGSRAEFGQLLPLLMKLEKDDNFDLDFVVTGAHLSKNAGNTITEINSCPIRISSCIAIREMADNSQGGIGRQIADVIASFTEYFSDNRPDVLLIIGDRYEMFGIAVAASVLLIPIAHICGGSTTYGALDEVWRHSLTKMSVLHFTTCETYRKRVIQLGENPQRVYNVGSLAIENCLNVKPMTEKEFRKEWNIATDRSYCIVTFHPVTLEKTESEKEVYELIQALDEFPNYFYIITYANTDSGGGRINEIWKEASKQRNNFELVSSLGTIRYLTALRYCEMMIGNSSSGTTEGPALHIPTIDIGDRQQGRFFAQSIIHCEPKKEDIVAAIKKANEEEFREKIKNLPNPFGDGHTSERIVEILKKELFKRLEVKKRFYDIDFEVNYKK